MLNPFKKLNSSISNTSVEQKLTVQFYLTRVRVDLGVMVIKGYLAFPPLLEPCHHGCLVSLTGQSLRKCGPSAEMQLIGPIKKLIVNW